LTRKVIDKVGGSIGWACRDDVAGFGQIDRLALDAAEGQNL
jgi:hypothetical protein